MTDATSTPENLPEATQSRLRELFSREQISVLTARSDWRGLWAIVSVWLSIFAIFAGVAIWPNVVTVVLGVCLLAGRQLALAILEHEGAHTTLFKTRWMNDILADWLCARPIWQHLHKYRAHHRKHHTLTTTDADPDIGLYADYPVTRASMLRKILRDISGVTGVKLIIGLILMDVGILKWTVATNLEKLPQAGRRWWDYPLSFVRNAGGMMAANAMLFGLLYAVGQPWLYGLWVIAYITPFPLFVRIRSLAEHGMLPRMTDMFRNTRTTRAGMVARLFVAPMNVNYHLEHHVMAAVPYYRLPRLHAVLRERHVVKAPVGYIDVLKLAMSRQGA
jgi:fatty acid desaturase